MNPRPIAAAVAAAAISLLAERSSAAVAREGQVVMGTVLTVTVVAQDPSQAQKLARDAIEEVRRWDDALTIWRPDGELFRLNARAGQGSIAVSERLAKGLAAMLRYAAETSGAFDPAAVMRTDAQIRAHDPVRRIADVLTVRHLAEPVRDEATLVRGSALDPGAIGKGLALDAAVSLLQKGGAVAAFLDFGGSSQTALGVPPGDPRGWTVLLSGAVEGSSHGTIHLRDASVSTSRSGATDTRPIVDPASGRPVPGPRLVTVVGDEAASADAWSTALVVLGPPAMERAASAGLEVLMDDAGSLRTSAGLRLEPRP